MRSRVQLFRPINPMQRLLSTMSCATLLTRSIGVVMDVQREISKLVFVWLLPGSGKRRGDSESFYIARPAHRDAAWKRRSGMARRMPLSCDVKIRWCLQAPSRQ